MQKVLRFNLGYLLELQHAQPTKFGRKNIKTEMEKWSKVNNREQNIVLDGGNI